MAISRIGVPTTVDGMQRVSRMSIPVERFDVLLQPTEPHHTTSETTGPQPVGRVQRFPHGDGSSSILPAAAFASRAFTRPGATTLIVKNLPAALSLQHIVQLWPSNSPEAPYDMLYMPISNLDNSTRHKGYIFINFLMPQVAERFLSRMQGQRLAADQEQDLEIEYARLQGLGEHLTRFRRQRLHRLPATHWPLLFEAGRPVDFQQLVISPSPME